MMNPVRRIDISPPLSAASDGVAPSPSSRRVLIVEDNAFVADQCEEALAGARHQVVGTVPTAEDAVRVAHEPRPDLVLMDVYLAGPRDGVDAATEIFQRLGVRSIFISALFEDALRARAERARPIGWLAKPFSDTRLVSTVQGAIREMAAAPAGR